METRYFIFIALILFQLALAGACTPDYQCGDWSLCNDSMQLRVCRDVACGQQDIIERQLCTSEGGKCIPRLTCNEWTPCGYLQKTTDLFLNKISFSGIQTRECLDINSCVDNFTDERACSDSYNVNFVKITQCGETFMVALDINSNKPVSKISIDALRQRELNIAFIQGNFTYCPYCYNGLKDHDETGVDCGGSCKPCKDENISFVYFVTIAWAASFVLLFILLFLLIGDKSYRLRFEFFRAYAALEEKNIEGAIKAEKRIKALYSKLPYEQQKSFAKELAHFSSRLGDYIVSFKHKRTE
jgi:hypothetical protein